MIARYFHNHKEHNNEKTNNTDMTILLLATTSVAQNLEVNNEKHSDHNPAHRTNNNGWVRGV